MNPTIIERKERWARKMSGKERPTVRSQDRLRTLPIIIVTTRGDEASRVRALEAGASRFMTKPFDPQAIQAEVRSLLDLGGSAAQP